MNSTHEPEDSTDAPPIVRVEALEKTFHIGFFRKRVEAVRGVDFEVRQGEVFGLLGPNGAGKTTTLKMLLGLIFPSAGKVQLFGGRPGDRSVMARLGYLPENPYVYSYLRPLEFLDLCGRLNGLPRAERHKRSQELVERVGLGHAVDRPIGKFSKGMTQRIGLAQALLHDPELLILDEPMSGLDPIGRKQVREMLIEERRRGKTLIFTSHILSDVERICDRVVILRRGRVTHRGALRDLLRTEDQRVDVAIADVPETLERALLTEYAGAHTLRGTLRVEVSGEDAVGPLLTRVLAAGARVESVTPHREELEKLFLEPASDPTSGPAAQPEADA